MNPRTPPPQLLAGLRRAAEEPDLSALLEADGDFAVPPSANLSEPERLALLARLAVVRRRVDAWSAALAGEVAAASAASHGYRGLAQRLGARTPEALVQRVTGVSRRDARALVQVGTMVMDAGPAADGAGREGRGAVDASAQDGLFASPDRPWLAGVASAVRAGRMALAAADSIRSGLGEPVGAATPERLTEAVDILLAEVASWTPEQLAARARQLRDAIDIEGVAAREEALRAKRYLHLTPQTDGMTRMSGLLDPESAAIVTAAYDAATSPRRGGPRFVDASARQRADEIVADTRSTEQIAVDTFVQLIALATAADPGELLGVRRPPVTVLVTEGDLREQRGAARLEGQSAAVSIATVQRQICEVGVTPVLFDDDGRVLNLGRTQRPFSARQRTALAARDGGCRFPGCERPPSWCEAHHIVPWSRGGTTDVDVGILLCRHHHLLLHNNGWQIARRRGGFDFIPPADVDASRTPIASPCRSPLLDRLTG